MESKIKIYGKSAKLQEMLRTARLVAATDVPVLITGETGTGKKSFAKDIHQRSARNKQQMVNINCADLANEINESVDRGNETSEAQNLYTAIVRAHQGSLFLDEVSELTPQLQLQLLQFLETGKIRQTGSTQYDVRLITASKTSLHDQINAGRFDSDLYYRLNVVPLELPLLREREGDIGLLMTEFFKDLAEERQLTPPAFTRGAMAQLNQQNWQGNVRELHNFCERMIILFSGRTVDITNLPRTMLDDSRPVKTKLFHLPATGIELEAVEVDLMQQALAKTSGNKSRAARLLGLTRDTFLYRLKKHSIGT